MTKSSSESMKATLLSRGFPGVSGCHTDLVVPELALEDVLVHGPAAVVEPVRDVEHVAQYRALPRHDHERLGRVVVADDRHARHHLVAGRLRGRLLAPGGYGRDQEHDAAGDCSGHGVYLPVRARRSLIHMAAFSSPGTASA